MARRASHSVESRQDKHWKRQAREGHEHDRQICRKPSANAPSDAWDEPRSASRSTRTTFQQIQKYEKGVNHIARVGYSRYVTSSKFPVQFFFDGAPAIAGHVGKGAKAPLPAYISDFLATSDGLALVRTFHADRRLRATPFHRPPRRGNRRRRGRPLNAGRDIHVTGFGKFSGVMWFAGRKFLKSIFGASPAANEV